MGRPKTVKAKAPKAKPSAAKPATVRKSTPKKAKTRPLPKDKNDMAELAKYHTEYSKVTLGNRINSLSPENRALFTKLVKRSARTVQRWAPSGNRCAWPQKIQTAAKAHWKTLVEEHMHAATMKKLQDEVEIYEEVLVPVRTLKSWILCRQKPYAPPYTAPSNDPSAFWKQRSIGSQ
jgi:hypothetical protein